MNTVAKCGVSGTTGADRDTVDASPRDNVGPDGWAAALLREVGLPVSRPRRLVLDALRGRERPVTAQDLHWELKLRSREPSAPQTAPGLSTIYRILAILADQNVVHCFHRDGQTAYRLCAPRRHDHLLCRCCGRVQEYPADQTQQWVNRLVVEEGFAVEGYRIEVVGLCAACHPRCPITGKHHNTSGGAIVARNDPSQRPE
jgi:Fur family transcriptional regulator, ferric uptake regulator